MSMLSGLVPGLGGLEQLRALIEAAVEAPIHSTLGLSLVTAEEGFVVVEGMPGEAHLNPSGIVHGGYMATMLDTACGCAVHSTLAPQTGFSTIELKISYHRAVTPQTGKVRAEGRVVSRGRRVAFSEARLTDASGRLLASATSSLLIMPTS